MLYSDAFERYRNNEMRVQKWVSQFVSLIQAPNKKVLLDCGCGTGRFTLPLSALFMKTFGVDKDNVMLEIARKKNSCVIWIQADASEIPIKENSVDVILASMLIEHLDSLDSFLCEACRLLKEDGVLLIRTMLSSDIDKTTWYSFSEKARIMELNRTYGFESLIKRFSNYGFVLSQSSSLFNVVEKFSNSNIAARLISRCYEVLHHLDESDYNELINRAIEWERITDSVETMSSSLLVYRRRNA